MASSRSSERIPLFRVNLPPREELMPALEEVLYSGQVAQGPRVDAFESAFREHVGASHARSFNSGTAALHTALLVAGVGQGDEVISTPVTAEPTNMAIRHSGAKIVWADVDPTTGNVTAESIGEVVTERTRAIVVVDYGGVPVALDEIAAVADRHGIALVEDAAHALGARYGGRPIGSHARFVAFSFQAIKHMTTVDGGMLTFQREEDARRATLLRWFGIDREAPRTETDVAVVGFKYHMNDVAATIGLTSLRHIAPVVRCHVENGRFLDDALSDIDGIALPRWNAAAEPSYWFYTVLAERRDDLARRLDDAGIASSTVHRRNDRHSVFAESRRELPGVDAFSAQVLHLPCGWWVGDEERARIVDTLRAGW